MMKFLTFGGMPYLPNIGLSDDLPFEHLENAVYLHLLQRGYRIYVGKIDHKEIDFVADRNGLKVYIQVCLQVTEKTTSSREFGNLLMIRDNYPKYVITLNDIIIGNDYQGIRQLNLIDFLLLDL